MKYWTEITSDAYSYFQWFSKDEAIKRIGYVPELSVFSIIGTMIYSNEDKELFRRLCSELVEKLAIDEYRFFIFGVIDTIDVGSKISKYQKLWRRLGAEFNLDDFILGPEVEFVEEKRLGYASIAEFKVNDFAKAIQIMSSNQKKYSIFSSKKQNCSTEEFTKSLLKKVYIGGDIEEIDYFKLALTLCPEGDLVFRWGDASEECELDIITLAENEKLFEGISFNT